MFLLSMTIVSLLGYTYFITNLKSKYFLEFQALVECMFNHKIISVQSNWGREYEHLNSLFRKVGIAHQVSCPHTHKQNGAAERKHHHIVEMGLTLLAHTSMPLKYWYEAFLVAVYIINRTRTKLLSYDTPLHRLLGATPDYSSFHVFGCACWPNLHPYNSHKLELRSTHCVFLGYNSMHMGFKCLDIFKGCVYISRDVILMNLCSRLPPSILMLVPDILLMFC
jgi:hypothetical protein